MILLNVTVGDDNDNYPTFQQPLYSVRVPESAQPGIMLTRVVATDRDSGDNAKLQYSIKQSSSSKIKRIFRLDGATGKREKAGSVCFNLNCMHVTCKSKSQCLVGYGQ